MRTNSQTKLTNTTTCAVIVLSDSPLQTEGADLSLAQQAMDKVVMYEQGVTATPNSIYIAIDIDPFDMFEKLGITTILGEDSA